MIQLELETPLGKVLIEENGIGFSKSITQHKAFLNQPLGKAEQIILCVTFLFKRMTLNKKYALIMNRSDVMKRASSSGTGIDNKKFMPLILALVQFWIYAPNQLLLITSINYS
jgi:hypothetical protein